MAGFSCWGRLPPVLMSSEQSLLSRFVPHIQSKARLFSFPLISHFARAMKISLDNLKISCRNLFFYPSTFLLGTSSPVLMMSSAAFSGSLFCLVLIHGSNSKRDRIRSRFYIRTTITLSHNNSMISSRSSFILSSYNRPIHLSASFDPTHNPTTCRT